jgi:hypothetical protein
VRRPVPWKQHSARHESLSTRSAVTVTAMVLDKAAIPYGTSTPRTTIYSLTCYEIFLLRR